MTIVPTIDELAELNELITGSPARILNHTHIDSALSRPFHTFGGQPLHPTLLTQAAALLEGLVAAHGFDDGNKRTSWITTKTFLIANGIPTRVVEPHAAADFVEGVAIHTYAGPAVATWIADNLTGT